MGLTFRLTFIPGLAGTGRYKSGQKPSRLRFAAQSPRSGCGGGSALACPGLCAPNQPKRSIKVSPIVSLAAFSLKISFIFNASLPDGVEFELQFQPIWGCFSGRTPYSNFAAMRANDLSRLPPPKPRRDQTSPYPLPRETLNCGCARE